MRTALILLGVLFRWGRLRPIAICEFSLFFLVLYSLLSPPSLAVSNGSWPHRGLTLHRRSGCRTVRPYRWWPVQRSSKSLVAAQPRMARCRWPNFSKRQVALHCSGPSWKALQLSQCPERNALLAPHLPPASLRCWRNAADDTSIAIRRPAAQQAAATATAVFLAATAASPATTTRRPTAATHTPATRPALAPTR